jgi:hypothetical protein
MSDTQQFAAGVVGNDRRRVWKNNATLFEKYIVEPIYNKGCWHYVFNEKIKGDKPWNASKRIFGLRQKSGGG